MSDAENVALWLGIIVGIAGVVLSVVAIWFAFWVNDRAARVNDQTIQSLQKIETTVERLSADTTGLIKAGWDKMLGQVCGTGLGPSEQAQSSATEIASGLSSEMMAELEESGVVTHDEAKRIESLIEELGKKLTAQISAASTPARLGSQLDRLVEQLEGISMDARELVAAISEAGRHLTRKEYRSLLNSPLSDALRELREAGLLAPFLGYSPEGEQIPVYYFRSAIAPMI